MSRPGAIVAAAACVALLAGCGADRVPAGTVADAAADVLAERTGVRSAIFCPEELEAESGQELRCVLTPDGERERYGVTVTVTSVDGDQVDVDVAVDAEPVG